MTHALHGLAGLPEDMHGLLRAAGGLCACPNLWHSLRHHPGTDSLRGFARHLHECSAPDVTRPRVLIGYSLGGRLALHALLEPPLAWDAAIILSAHPGLRTAEERAARLAQDQAWATRFLHDPWEEVLAAWNAQPVLAGPARAALPELESWRGEIARACDLWSLGRQDDLRPRLPAVACPVLWLTGAQDEKFTALAREACLILPHAQHRVIPGAGHRVHRDAPGAVADAVREFLASLGRESSSHGRNSL